MNDQALAALLMAAAAISKGKGKTMSGSLSDESQKLLDAAFDSQGKAKDAQHALEAAQGVLDDANHAIADAKTESDTASAQARTDAQAALASISAELGLTPMPPGMVRNTSQGRQSAETRRR